MSAITDIIDGMVAKLEAERPADLPHDVTHRPAPPIDRQPPGRHSWMGSRDIITSDPDEDFSARH